MHGQARVPNGACPEKVVLSLRTALAKLTSQLMVAIYIYIAAIYIYIYQFREWMLYIDAVYRYYT